MSSDSTGWLVTEGVADRNAEPLGMVVAELEIVADKVDTRFRPYEETAERVKLNACAHISQQVVAAHKIGAGERSAGNKVLVETNALAAQPTHEFQGCMFSERRGVYGINVVKDWPEFGKVVGGVAGRAPRYLAAYSEVLEQQEVGAEAGEHATSYILGKEISRRING